MKTEGKYKILGNKQEPLYYNFDWEVRGVMAYLPNSYLPCAAFNPDGTIFDVKVKPPIRDSYSDK